jgi:hypothetical protein
MPGRMSHGAIHHPMLCDSSFAQTASAYGWSRAEWLMKTSWAIEI